MARQRRTQGERRDDTRNRLLAAAFRVFARDGVGASVADIAAEANCSTGAIYTHFSGKRDLLLAVFDSRFPDWANSYFNALAQSTAPKQAIDAAAHHWEELLDEQPARSQLYIEFWMAALRDADLREPFRERQRQIIDTMAKLIGQHVDFQETAPPVSATTMGAVVTALADGLAIQYLAGTSADAAETLRTGVSLLIRALKSPNVLEHTDERR